MSKLTDANRARLEKLAAYLEGLPKDYRHFGMGDWMLATSKEAELKYAQENGGVPSCGTVACAAGHGPAAGILVPNEYIEWFDGKPEILWHLYSELFAGPRNKALSMWCFSGGWIHTDNTHWGAAARIRYLLDHGAPPDSYPYRDDRIFPPLYAPYRVDAKVAADA